MLPIQKFYDDSLNLVSDIPIHRETMAILNIHCADLNPRLVTNLDYSFFKSWFNTESGIRLISTLFLRLYCSVLAWYILSSIILVYIAALIFTSMLSSPPSFSFEDATFSIEYDKFEMRSHKFLMSKSITNLSLSSRILWTKSVLFIDRISKFDTVNKFIYFQPL